MSSAIQTRDRINNGSSIKISSCNPDNKEQLYSIMGRIKFWTLENTKLKKKPVRQNGEGDLFDDLLGDL